MAEAEEQAEREADEQAEREAEPQAWREAEEEVVRLQGYRVQGAGLCEVQAVPLGTHSLG